MEGPRAPRNTLRLAEHNENFGYSVEYSQWMPINHGILEAILGPLGERSHKYVTQGGFSRALGIWVPFNSRFGKGPRTNFRPMMNACSSIATQQISALRSFSWARDWFWIRKHCGFRVVYYAMVACRVRGNFNKFDLYGREKYGWASIYLKEWDSVGLNVSTAKPQQSDELREGYTWGKGSKGISAGNPLVSLLDDIGILGCGFDKGYGKQATYLSITTPEASYQKAGASQAYEMLGFDEGHLSFISILLSDSAILVFRKQIWTIIIAVQAIPNVNAREISG
ncbi:hypothetical protein Tco_0098631 [Tanacetum coccineum]